MFKNNKKKVIFSILFIVLLLFVSSVSAMLYQYFTPHIYSWNIKNVNLYIPDANSYSKDDILELCNSYEDYSSENAGDWLGNESYIHIEQYFGGDVDISPYNSYAVDTSKVVVTKSSGKSFVVDNAKLRKIFE